MIWTGWWVWAVGSAVLIILEILAPGYVLLGFGIGAAVVALGLLTGIFDALFPVTGQYGLTALLLIWGVASGIVWLVLRRIYGAPGGSVKTFDEDVND
ncbi:NfeD family protein [Jannaschia aquimarina]|uniref:NfeD-like C-terminal domain-containing protein n=1 Tax=Jannaschia aquimarina TaxID=935700 RepID=A0A0D1EHT3_9RHOB|nr:hypothetical protein [Jannaschia aquimarina]KIT15385.1 hypothetical protein jaqu_28180 [Jannaschia aquimarina]SNT23068.1 hypothetical protein SAMN05421775_10896 [Jannaschia aquimarina]